MTHFDYKAVPAPKKAPGQRGIKGTDNLFAHALGEALNSHAADGWEYIRADTLPCEERAGLTGKKTTYQTVLIFRRPAAPAQARPVSLPQTDRVEPESPAPTPAPAPAQDSSKTDDKEPPVSKPAKEPAAKSATKPKADKSG